MCAGLAGNGAFVVNVEDPFRERHLSATSGCHIFAEFVSKALNEE